MAVMAAGLRLNTRLAWYAGILAAANSTFPVPGTGLLTPWLLQRLGLMPSRWREAHLLLQLFKDCCQVTAPGVLFIAEAIVAPVEIIKYFGEDAVIAKECEIAYNATFMALLWEAVATKNAKLLDQGIRSLPDKLDRATWLNYLRCHDDIGLGFDDTDIVKAGYDPYAHRRFLVDYFTGRFEGSDSRGQPFGVNLKTGDARISGSLASLATRHDHLPATAIVPRRSDWDSPVPDGTFVPSGTGRCPFRAPQASGCNRNAAGILSPWRS